MKSWKVQKFFGDVVYDLRSRGLLPVVILLLVAMLAVPLLISRGSGESTASLQPASATAQIPPEAEQAVVAYQPGIRDYKKRLNDLSPKDPFRQQFARSAAAASALKSTVTTPTTSSSGSSGTTTDTVTGTGGGSSTGKKKKKSKSVTVTYQTNILAGDASAQLTPFDDVQSMTPLPSQTAPAVIYFGLSPDYKRALFLVSNRVARLDGPGTCVPAPDDCALLYLGPGQSEDVLYTGDGKTYRIVVSEIKRFTK